MESNHNDTDQSNNFDIFGVDKGIQKVKGQDADLFLKENEIQINSIGNSNSK